MGKNCVSRPCTVCIIRTKQYRFSSPLAFWCIGSSPQFSCELLSWGWRWKQICELLFVIHAVFDVSSSLKDPRVLGHQRSARWVWLLWSPITRRRRNEGRNRHLNETKWNLCLKSEFICIVNVNKKKKKSNAWYVTGLSVTYHALLFIYNKWFSLYISLMIIGLINWLICQPVNSRL